MTTDTTETTEDDLRKDWAVVLAEYWLQTDWDQFPDKKRRSESFAERLLSAQNTGGVHEAVEELADGLGMAAPDLPTQNLEPLVDNNEESMRVLRRERIYLVSKAKEVVQNYFEDKDDAENSDPEPTTSELSDFVTED